MVYKLMYSFIINKVFADALENHFQPCFKETFAKSLLQSFYFFCRSNQQDCSNAPFDF